MNIQRKRFDLWKKAWLSIGKNESLFFDLHHFTPMEIIKVVSVLHGSDDATKFLMTSQKENIDPVLIFLNYCQYAMIDNFDGIGDFSSTHFKSVNQLPKSQGIYMFTRIHGHDSISLEIPLYIGKTNDLSKRFQNHHRIDEIKLIHNTGSDVMFYYFAGNSCFDIANLSKLESLLIEMLIPVLNGTEYLSTNKSEVAKLSNCQPLLSSSF